jgi:hypothetical protein
VTDVAVETPPDCLTTYITGNDAFFVRPIDLLPLLVRGERAGAGS